MKTKYFIRAFIVVLIFSIITGVYLFLNKVNNTSGFFTDNYGILVFLVSILIILLISIPAFLVKRCPTKMPKVNSVLSLSSLLLGFVMFVKLFYTAKNNEFSIYNFFVSINMIIDGLTAFFFILYGFKKFFKFHIKRIFYVLPLIYWVLLLLTSYLKIAKMAIISENALMILACAATTMFMLYFAKIANNIKGENNYKYILILGSLSAIFCEFFAIPQLLLIFNNSKSVSHNNPISPYLFFATGIFVIAFLGSFFSNKNLKIKNRRRDGSEKVMPPVVDNEVIADLEEQKDNLT